MSGGKKLRERVRASWMSLCGRMLPMDRQCVAFISFSGASYSDNPKAVSEALHALRPELRQVWLFRQPAAKAALLPDYITPMKIHSLRAIKACAQAGAWVFNGNVQHYFRKRPGQFYVQTWHGDRGFKVCLAETGKHGLLDSAMIDVAVSGSRHADRFFAEAFQYTGELLRVGSPRNDRLLRPDDALIQKTRAALGLRDGERVLLYAPTMRDELRKGRFDVKGLDFARLLDLLENRDGAPWRMLARTHTRLAGFDGLTPDPRIVDACAYEDMRDLLCVSDLLITDYSSSAGDFPLTGKPVLLYQPDLQQFMASERAFYFDIAASPFKTAADWDALCALAVSQTGDAAQQNDRDILAFFGAWEGGEAAALTAQRILAELDGRAKS